MKKIGILGSATVAQTLAAGLRTHGYEARISSRTPEKLAEFTAATGIAAGTYSDVAAWGDAIVLAVKGHAAKTVLRQIGESRLEGKVIMDATNPIAEAPPSHGVLEYFTGPNESLMEDLQAVFPTAHFVKVFNCVGVARMVNPAFADGKPTMFICGNDAAAKADVMLLLERFGWEVFDAGMARAARAIEPLAMLWCIPGFLQNSWTHAFKVVWK